MRLIRLSVVLLGLLTCGHFAVAQTTGGDFHRNDILRIGKSPAADDVRGEARRLYQSARNYWHGESDHPKDRAKAVELFKLAARADYPPALYYLSQIYFTGEEVPVDEWAGMALLRRAAQLGLQDAVIRLTELEVVDSRYARTVYLPVAPQVVVPASTSKPTVTVTFREPWPR